MVDQWPEEWLKPKNIRLRLASMDPEARMYYYEYREKAIRDITSISEDGREENLKKRWYGQMYRFIHKLVWINPYVLGISMWMS